MERYIDIYVLLFSCTCARVHFSLVIVQLVKKLGSTINFFFVGFLCSNLKRTCRFAFFFLEKCMRPAIQICNDELYICFVTCCRCHGIWPTNWVTPYNSAASRDVFLIPKISYVICPCKFVLQGACIFF